jgi:hypothetical protein
LVRTPLIVRSKATRQRYFGALVFMVIACVPFVFFATGIASIEDSNTIVMIGIALFLYSLFSMANTFLGYPQLLLAGDRLTLIQAPLWDKRFDLSGLGAAYPLLTPSGRSMQMALAFRTEEEEAAHRAAEKFPHAPELSEAAITVPIGGLVGNDIDKADAVAADINAHRGF